MTTQGLHINEGLSRISTYLQSFQFGQFLKEWWGDDFDVVVMQVSANKGPKNWHEQ